MKALRGVIAEANLWNAGMYPDNPKDLSPEQATKLYDLLDGNMSPENLTCDGELPRSQVRARAQKYMNAARQLKKLGFAPPKMWCIDPNDLD